VIAQEPNSKELTFLTELGIHVNRWVAITNYGSDDEAIVAIGDTIGEVKEEAESKGFKDVTFFKSTTSQQAIRAVSPFARLIAT